MNGNGTSVLSQFACVRLSQRGISLTAQDKEASATLAADKQGEEGSMMAVSRIFPPKLIGPVLRAHRGIRQEFRENSVGWLVGGAALIPVSRYQITVDRVAGPLQTRVDEERKILGDNWEDVISQCRHFRGTAFKAEDYPSVEDLANCFASSLIDMPHPLASPFFKGIEAGSDIRVAEAEARIKEANKSGIRMLRVELAERMTKPLQELVRKCGELDRGDAQVLRQTTMDHVKDLLTVVIELAPACPATDELRSTLHMALDPIVNLVPSGLAGDSAASKRLRGVATQSAQFAIGAVAKAFAGEF